MKGEREGEVVCAREGKGEHVPQKGGGEGEGEREQESGETERKGEKSEQRIYTVQNTPQYWQNT